MAMVLAVVMLVGVACSTGKPAASAGQAGGDGHSMGGNGGAVNPGSGGRPAPTDAGSDHVCVQTPSAPLSFTTQMVRPVGAGAASSAIAIGASGKPVFIYLAADATAGNQVWGASLPITAGDGGVTASVATRLSRGHSGGVAAAAPTVRIAAGGAVRIAYVEQYLGTNTVRYVEWSGDPTQDPTDSQVDANTAFAKAPALALDQTGNPAIAFLTLDNMIHFAARPQSAWQGEVVPTGGVLSSAELATAIGPDGMPFVFTAVPASASSGIFASTRSASGWAKTVVDAGASDAGLRSAVSPAGQVTVMFTTSAGIGIAVQNGAGWAVTSPLKDASGLPLAPAADFDFVFGPSGDIQAAFARVDGGIGYLRFDGCAWSAQAVETSFDPHSGARIAVDGSGSPHVAYLDDTSHTLWYARVAP